MAEESAVRVRAATARDMPAVLDMIQELATYEGVPDGPQITLEDLIRDGFECPQPWFFSVVAEVGDEVVGHALCNRAYSSWTRRAFYLEDLFVREGARRRGVGTALLAHVARLAARDGVHRIDWHVLESNAPALALYERVGARDLRRTEGRAALRLDAPAIHNLAAQHTHTTTQ